MKNGMTLIEVMISMTIIGFLTVLVTFYLRSQVFKANDVKRKSDLNKIGIALEEYEKDHDCYPAVAIVTCNPGLGLKPYLDKIPCDVVFQTSYGYQIDTATTCAKWYRLFSKLENSKDSDYQVGIGPGSLYNFVYTSPNAP